VCVCVCVCNVTCCIQVLYNVVVVLRRDCSSQDSFYFDPAPVSQVVVQGEDVRLRCEVSSRQFIKFYWTLNDRTLSNTSRRYQDGSDLRILSVNRTLDAGSFRCVAVNVSTGIAVRSGQAQLTVYCKLLDTSTNHGRRFNGHFPCKPARLLLDLPSAFVPNLCIL